MSNCVIVDRFHSYVLTLFLHVLLDNSMQYICLHVSSGARIVFHLPLCKVSLHCLNMPTFDLDIAPWHVPSCMLPFEAYISRRRPKFVILVASFLYGHFLMKLWTVCYMKINLKTIPFSIPKGKDKESWIISLATEYDTTDENYCRIQFN